MRSDLESFVFFQFLLVYYRMRGVSAVSEELDLKLQHLSGDGRDWRANEV
jgi:hypothetical protein